jgi:hypothetical protein
MTNGIPAGAISSFVRGCDSGVRRAANGEKRIDFNKQPREMRLLCERPTDPADARELFTALSKVGEIKEISPGKFALTTPEPTIKELFTESRLTPIAQTSLQFLRKLKSRRFIGFVEMHYPGIPDWAREALSLAQSNDAKMVAERLVELGVLVENPDGLYAMDGNSPASLANLPEGIYRLTNTTLVGLSDRQFVQHLLDSDWFYNVCFWKASDAVSADRASVADMPEFVGWYRDRHLS